MIFWPSPYTRSLKTSNIVFDGNSITAWDDATAVGKWTDRLRLLAPYNSPDCIFRNMGQPGISTWNLAARAATVIDPLYMPGRQNICCVWEVVNDVGQFPANPIRNAENLRDYCLARKAKGWKVVVFGVQNMRVPGTGITAQADFDNSRPIINSYLRDNWRSFADQFVNPSDSYKLNMALPVDVPDGGHPTSEALNELIPLVDTALKLL